MRLNTHLKRFQPSYTKNDNTLHGEYKLANMCDYLDFTNSMRIMLDHKDIFLQVNF